MRAEFSVVMTLRFKGNIAVQAHRPNLYANFRLREGETVDAEEWAYLRSISCFGLDTTDDVSWEEYPDSFTLSFLSQSPQQNDFTDRVRMDLELAIRSDQASIRAAGIQAGVGADDDGDLLTFGEQEEIQVEYTTEVTDYLQ